MSLTTGDLAAITSVITVITTASGIIMRYYVKAEIKTAIDALRLELAKERIGILETRADAQKVGAN